MTDWGRYWTEEQTSDLAETIQTKPKKLCGTHTEWLDRFRLRFAGELAPHGDYSNWIEADR